MSEPLDNESLEDWLDYALAIHSAAVKIEGHEPLVGDCSCEIHAALQMLRAGGHPGIEQQFGLGTSSGKRVSSGVGKAHRHWVVKTAHSEVTVLAK